MNRLKRAKAVAVVSALVEGNGINSTVRMTGVSKPTILKLLGQLGAACADHHHAFVRNVRSKHVQVDEIWQFVYAKAKNVPNEKRETFGYGDVWTWVALDADSKMVLSWRIGPRDGATALDLMTDLADRIVGRVQLTTDGFKSYFGAIEEAFGDHIDFATLHKVYSRISENETRYSPAKIMSSTTEVIRGNPDPRHISTSYVERQNLTMRMGMRRFTRLTNGFSKKLENHAAAVALHYMHYNFARVHKTLRVTPAMEAGLATHVWSIDEIVALSDRRSGVAA
jgi:IS1 family transposase